MRTIEFTFENFVAEQYDIDPAVEGMSLYGIKVGRRSKMKGLRRTHWWEYLEPDEQLMPIELDNPIHEQVMQFNAVVGPWREKVGRLRLEQAIGAINARRLNQVKEAVGHILRRPQMSADNMLAALRDLNSVLAEDASEDLLRLAALERRALEFVTGDSPDPKTAEAINKEYAEIFGSEEPKE